MEKLTGQGVVCMEGEEGQAGRASQRRWLADTHKGGAHSRASGRRQLKDKKAKTSNLPFAYSRPRSEERGGA